MRRSLVWLSAMLLFAGCGLAEGDRDQDNKYVRLHFTDQAFEAYCISKFDLDGDGSISRYEAQRVLTLDCAGRGIVDLSEIYEFTHLRHLYCADNQITTLNLRRNPELSLLDCAHNRLSRLNLEGLRGLVELHCDDNQLGSLELHDLASLSRITCDANHLLTLDLSGCSQLIERLSARDNPALEVLYKRATQQIRQQSLDGHTRIEER